MSGNPKSTTACVDPVGTAGCKPAGARYRYQKVSRGRLLDVIVDIDAAGQEEWADHYAGEVRWFPFTPSPEERAMLECWRATGQAPAHGPFRVVNT
jgi:hypothetical protein